MSDNPSLAAWSSFYVMTGSSAAALTGLVFVVTTLLGSREDLKSSEGVAIFSTPTVMHFGTTLLVAAVLTAPWRSFTGPRICIACVALLGLAYVVRSALRTRRLAEYRLDLDDWIWYAMLPLVTYGTLLGGAMALHRAAGAALYVIAGAVLLMLFIGIRNAWDVAAFIATGGPDRNP